VSSVAKGPFTANGTIILTTAVSDVSCGYPFQTGRQYLVYAQHSDGASGQHLQTDLCSGTQLIAATQTSQQSNSTRLFSSTTAATTQFPDYQFEGAVLFAAAVVAIEVIVSFFVIVRPRNSLKQSR
jgi:hypothetical protein